MTLGKDKFTVKVKVDDEKHIYIISDKHSYHDISLIVMVIYMRYEVVPINKVMLKYMSL